jgi:ABC-type Fe3+-hydroxamate transport system substrate-binding protein
MRIVSCVPSLTEWVAFLEPGFLVGRTRFCVSPEGIRAVPVIGGTRKLNIHKILDLKPDLVLAVLEENNKEEIQEIQRMGIRVEVLQIRNWKEAIIGLNEIGKWMARETEASGYCTLMENVLSSLKPIHGEPTAAYFIWHKPWMAAGGDTFIHSMMELAGLKNIFSHLNRYPEIDIEILELKNPDFILLSDEPFPFREAHKKALEALLPRTKILLVDGAAFSWYSQRMANFPSYMTKLFNIFRS